MQRCSESAGNFTVTMLHSEDHERRQQLNAHAPVYKTVEIGGQVITDYKEVIEGLPVLSSATPFKGELCVHEVEQLKHSSRDITPELFFVLQEV